MYTNICHNMEAFGYYSYSITHYIGYHCFAHFFMFLSNMILQTWDVKK